MRRTISLAILFLCFCISINGQIVRGKITDQSGRALPGAALYITEKRTGVGADHNGEFQISLQEGLYNAEVSCLGYKKERVTFNVGSKDTYLEFKLSETVYELKEIMIKSKGYNRADEVMKQAIAKAPYYRYQLTSYKADSYVKGSMKISKVPKILKLQVNNQKIDVLINKLFVLESYSAIEFNAPDKYKQTIKAFRSTIPTEFNPTDFSTIIQSSIYDPEMFEKISPLNSNAFSYYKFKFLGITNEAGKIINKIQVLPKKNGPKMFSGFLYIVDDTWNVTYLDLSTTEMGVTTTIKTDYNIVSPAVYLPTSYNLALNVNTMGVVAEGRFHSSITYNEFRERGSSSASNLAMLSQKSAPTKKQASKVSKSAERQLKRELTKPEKKDLEIKRDTNTKVLIDSTARTRDSLYWLQVRKVPLMPDEVVSYQKKDSISKEIKKIIQEDSIKQAKKQTFVTKMIFGGSFYTKKDSLIIKYGGLIKVPGDYNFTDGLWLGNTFSVGKNFTKHNYGEFSPTIYYGLASHRLSWKADAFYTFAPMLNGYFGFSFGDMTTDFNQVSGAPRLLNAYFALVGGRSDIKFFRNRFIRTSYSTDIANGLRLSVTGQYSRRDTLSNVTDYNFLGNVPKSNMPNNIYGATPDDHDALSLDIMVSYTPEFYYRVRNGRKSYSHSKYPTFSARFAQAFPIEGLQSASYKMLEFSINHSIRLGYYDQFSYYVNAGGFLHSDRVWLNDFKHFRTNSLFVSSSEFSKEFALIDNYWLSTNKQWLQANVKYRSDFLFLKNLPFMQKSIMSESVHLLSVWLPDQKNVYTEVGYSIGVDMIGRAAIYAGFNNSEYQRIGFRITIPLLSQLYPKIFR